MTSTFGDLLRRNRRAAWLTQEELAEQAGLSGRAISDLERGINRTPRKDTIRLLAMALHLSPTERALFEHCARPDAGTLEEAAPPQKPLASDLPIPPTFLIGRQEAVAHVCQLLRLREVRLVTLTGPAGVGKTRLALEIANELHSAFAQGVVFVSLASISDPNLVATAIAHAVGLRETGGQPIVENLKASLRSIDQLLVLDNFEQVITAAPLLSELLAIAPGIKLLVTSREILRLRGEQEVVVPPLVLPPLRESFDLAELTQYAAIALFLERARSVKPDLALSGEQVQAVVEICYRLDGLPLALELAAARIKVLPPTVLRTRLEQQLPLLTGGARDLPMRQQTMRDAIGWSYNLLTAEEQRLLRWLAVFVGGFALEAAEAIWDSTDDGGLEVLEGIGSLVDKSLLHQVEEENGTGRYRMFETIRAYALEQLAFCHEEANVCERHAIHYCQFAEGANHQMQGPDQSLWLNCLEQEHDNLRAALNWALTTAHYMIAMHIGQSLTLFWFFHGHFTEGRRWLEMLMDIDLPDLASMRSWVLNGAGVLACLQGDLEWAITQFTKSIRLARDLGDQETMAFSLTGLSGAMLYQNKVAEAVALAEEGLAIFRSYNNKWNTGLAITNLIPALLAHGQLDDAKQMADERLAIYRDLDNPWGIATSYNYLGLVVSAKGAYDNAQSFFHKALAHFLAMNDKWGSFEALAGLTLVVAAQNQLTRAAALFGATDALRDALGARYPAMYFRYDQVRASVRAYLDEPTYDFAYTIVRTLPLKDAITKLMEQEANIISSSQANLESL